MEGGGSLSFLTPKTLFILTFASSSSSSSSFWDWIQTQILESTIKIVDGIDYGPRSRFFFFKLRNYLAWIGRLEIYQIKFQYINIREICVYDFPRTQQRSLWVISIGLIFCTGNFIKYPPSLCQLQKKRSCLV